MNVDWVQISTVIGFIVTLVGGGFAAWEKWGKTKSETKVQAAGAKRDDQALTLDGVFRLVNELQEEVVRKAEQIVALEKRCDEQKKVLEDRILVHEAAIATLVRENEELRKLVREMQER